ncbi:DUF7520 family protein [Halomarina litorea]|uniref:DUF7520 family protein n=1 Tax=Halomarina litorea TaxID=2961595 RepID=UPI0020C1C3EC|nr:cox cluster protein [Halomarina sp. BCD28]
MSENARELGGRWFVLILYLTVVGITGVVGYLLGVFNSNVDPVLFGFIQLPPTPLGMAAFGAITLATILGVFVGAVVLVSRRYVDGGAGPGGQSGP